MGDSTRPLGCAEEHVDHFARIDEAEVGDDELVPTDAKATPGVVSISSGGR